MKLTTTLSRIRACSPCSAGWATLNKALGSDFDPEQEINLLKILETNGVQDMLWCLRATIQDSKRIASQLAIEFASEALPIFEDRRPNDARPRQCLQGCRDFLDGKITRNELIELRRAAAAACAAYADAAAAYAAYAADAAAACAAYADAAAACAAYADAAAACAAYADAAAARAKAKERQTEIIRMILSAD